MESKQKTLYMSRQLIEFNHIYKEFNDVYREAATKVGLSLSGLIFYTPFVRWGMDVCSAISVRCAVFQSRQ